MAARAASARPELVFGLVGALGTDLRQVELDLVGALRSVDYKCETVRVSSLIGPEFERLGLQLSREPDTDLDRLMDIGDELRSRVDGAAAAMRTVVEIMIQRAGGQGGNPQENDYLEREATATIINQLKHPSEVQHLRSVYGERFFLVGAWANEAERKKQTQTRLSKMHPDKSDIWISNHTDRLMARDTKDGDRKLGQRVRDTFAQADFYVRIRQGAKSETKKSIQRFVSLIFADPDVTPLPDEQSMAIAHTVSLRSSDAGRQVGAVVVDKHSEVIVTGTNEVPKAFGGQYWSGDEPDHRDFQFGRDFNKDQQIELMTQLLTLLRDDQGWFSAECQGQDIHELVDGATNEEGPWRDTRIHDLLEFGRVLHAEMAVLTNAARRGVSLEGETLYCTTYPCHLCARLIVGAGICQVVYVDPYLKSQVPHMYSSEITEDEGQNSVKFIPYEGVAPRRYNGLFRKRDRDRDRDGRFQDKDMSTASPRIATDGVFVWSIRSLEDATLEEYGQATVSVSE